ncbi:HotDog domain-containing protein [Aspergillus pseudonomiae]|uniref:HotDog domain-containing protein n=1 Tax=Aspergillus pseudonomiae TaxID=1506151 RepID=A0A5N7DKZ9_9EURO|nr:HotDog domain-containing protein [Aspergillus pseudonomiae]KAB8262273.1 HotDog domain-containing protein [Aspergillus pseudonomiae]KAE8407116.1 HotDog domain-containing protein [Aspergillus pseudonomiae]
MKFIDILTTVPPEQASLSFFASLPCSFPYLNGSSSYQPITLPSRYKKSDPSDTFFSETMNTPNTFPHILAFIRKEILRSNRPAWENRDREQIGPDIVILVHLGSGGNGFRDTVHGGVLGALLDEALACCIEFWACQLHNSEPASSETRLRLYTANLNTSYRAPVESPGIILVHAWLKSRQGRKWFLAAKILGEDNRTRAEASALWVSERATAM